LNSRLRCEDNSKQIVSDGMEWFDLAQDRDTGLSVLYDGASYPIKCSSIVECMRKY